MQGERREILSKLKVPKVNVARIGRPSFFLQVSFFHRDIRAFYFGPKVDERKKTLFFLLKINIETFQVKNVKDCTMILSYY